MPREEASAHRLFVEAPLAAGVPVPLARDPSHYLRNVLRLSPGDTILVFNGRDGEWRARLSEVGKRGVTLDVGARTREQTPPGTIGYAFAPLKAARLDYLVQKAVEMGVGTIEPVLTRRTQVSRLNLERIRANAIEAAEQCGVLSVPEIRQEQRLDGFLANLAHDRLLVFCDEGAERADPLAALASAPAGSVTLLVGPEGGFEDDERRRILARAPVLRLSLGPRIMRADTAAVAALALVQAARGDWRGMAAPS